MAIQQNANYSNLYDLSRPFIFKYQSTAGAINLVYIVQLQDQTSGVWNNITKEFRQPLNYGSNTDFDIDLSQILVDECQTTIRDLAEGDVMFLPNNDLTFRMIMVEEFFNTTTGYLEYNDNVNTWTQTYAAFGIDAATQHSETFNESQSDWLEKCRIINPYSWKRFLTNRPSYRHGAELCVGDSDFIHHYMARKNCVMKAFTINSTGAQSAHFDISSAIPSKGHCATGIGVPNIIDFVGQAYWSSLDTALNPVVSVHYYIFDNYNGTVASEQMGYKVKRNCCTTERMRVYWKNRKGGIDGYTFDGELSVGTKIKRKYFQRALGHKRHRSEDVNSIQYQRNNTFNQKSRAVGSINIEAQEGLSLTSKPEGEKALRWLSEIYTSPKVWVESVENGQLQAAYCTSNKASLKKKGSKMNVVKIQLTLSAELTTQR